MAVTAALSPSSLPQSSTGRLEVSNVKSDLPTSRSLLPGARTRRAPTVVRLRVRDPPRVKELESIARLLGRRSSRPCRARAESDPQCRRW